MVEMDMDTHRKGGGHRTVGRIWSRALAACRMKRCVRVVGLLAVLAACLGFRTSAAPAASVINTISVGNGPALVSSDGTHVWVANASDGTVSEIDAASASVVK